MEKTLILFIEQKIDNEMLKYVGSVRSISTNNRVTPDSKILLNLKADDCVLVYNAIGGAKNKKLISFDRLEIIDKAVSIYHEKELSLGLILIESYSNLNRDNKQWLIEPKINT